MDNPFISLRVFDFSRLLYFCNKKIVSRAEDRFIRLFYLMLDLKYPLRISRLILMLMTGLVCSAGHHTMAQDVDFILNENCRSYRTSFKNESEIMYMNSYMAQWSQTVEALYKTWATSYAIIGTQNPLLGKPHIASVVGITAGNGEDPLEDQKNISPGEFKSQR